METEARPVRPFRSFLRLLSKFSSYDWHVSASGKIRLHQATSLGDEFLCPYNVVRDYRPAVNWRWHLADQVRLAADARPGYKRPVRKQILLALDLPVEAS